MENPAQGFGFSAVVASIIPMKSIRIICLKCLDTIQWMGKRTSFSLFPAAQKHTTHPASHNEQHKNNKPTILIANNCPLATVKRVSFEIQKDI
jgi:hypothetical protein